MAHGPRTHSSFTLSVAAPGGLEAKRPRPLRAVTCGNKQGSRHCSSALEMGFSLCILSVDSELAVKVTKAAYDSPL